MRIPTTWLSVSFDFLMTAPLAGSSLPSSVYRGGKLTDWFNTRRVLEPIGYIPPAEYEERYYQQAAVAYVA